MPRALFCLFLLAALGCQKPTIDRTYTAKSQDSRVQFLVLHFTGGTWTDSMKILTEGSVSSHYLVRDQPARIYQLVDEERRAYHAGLSSWKGQTQLNAASIGIEIQNLGDLPGPGGKGVVYHDYPKAQLDLVVQLVREIVTRHGIRPDRVLGHSDIAPQRKVDPGPTFPWKVLADEGLILWPDPIAVAKQRPVFEAALPDVAWFQARLARHGFEVPRTGQLDPPTRSVLAAFQMKYRPTRYDGTPDAESAALLEVLTAR